MTNSEFERICKPFYQALEYYKPKFGTFNCEHLEHNFVRELWLGEIKDQLSALHMIQCILDMGHALSNKIGIYLDSYSFIAESIDILIDKAREYAVVNGTDRLSNFTTSSKYNVLEKTDYARLYKDKFAIINIASKHYGWIEDALCDRIEITEKGIHDHIVDAINYVLLYWAKCVEMNNYDFILNIYDTVPDSGIVLSSTDN